MFINKTRLFIMIFCVLLVSFNANCYEPEEVHKPLLEIAIKRYNQCRSQDSLYLTTQVQQRLIQGNIAMDRGLTASIKERKRLKHESAFALNKRVFNWHFYNPNKVKYSKVLFVEQSHKNLWKQLKKGVDSNPNINDKLLFVGGLIHLLEDLTVPAHVLPVYHGPTSIKYLGPWRLKPLVSYMQESPYASGLLIKDKIDSYEVDELALETALNDEPNLCSVLNHSISNFDKLRELTSHETIEITQTKIPKCGDSQWAIFWLEAEKEQYFGRYNIANGNILFGMKGTQQSGNHSCNFASKDERYRTFVNQLHLNAIKNDMRVLALTQRSFEQPKM